MVGGDIKIVMTLDDNGVDTKLVRMGEVVQRTTQRFEQMGLGSRNAERGMKSLAANVRDLVFAISIVRFALTDIHDIFLRLPRSILSTAGEFQRMQQLMVGLSKETDDTKRKLDALAAQNYIIKLSLNAPFSINAIQDAFVKMKSGGIDPMNGSLQALVDSVAKFGGSEEQMRRASVAIQQMAGKGVVSMEELRQQLGEAVPNAIELMAEGVGMSMPALVKAISNGQVEAASALDRMFTVMAIRNRGAAVDMMSTWTGALQQLTTNFELFKNQVATAGAEGGGSTFASEMQLAVIELNKMFASPEVKQFAYNLGTGLAGIVTFLREAIPLISSWGEYIKIAGIALVGYFGAQQFNGVLANIKKIRAEAEVLAAGPRSNKGGFLQSTIEEYRRMEIEQERQISRQRLATEEKIALNRRMVADNEKNASTVLSTLRRQQAAEVLATRQSVNLIREKAQAQIQAANEMTQQAGRAYAEAVRFENLANEARRNKKKSSEHVAQMNAYRQETIALQQNAVALRQNAQAEINRANAVMASVRANRDYIGVASQQASALRALNANLNNAITSLGQHASATQRASTASLAFKSVVSGFQTVFNAFGGWVTVVITGLAYATEKLMSFMNRWKRAEEFRRSVANGMATQEGIDEAEDRSAEIQRNVDAQQNLVTLRQRQITELQVQLDALGNSQLEQAQRKSLESRVRNLTNAMKEANDRLIKYQTDLDRQRQAVTLGRENLVRMEADSEGRLYEQLAQRNLSTKLRTMTDAQNKLDAAVAEARSKFMSGNPGADNKAVEAAIKPYVDARQEGLKSIYKNTLDFWRQEETRLSSEVAKSTGKQNQIFAAQLEAARAQVQQISQRNADLLGSVNLLGGSANKGAASKALLVQQMEERESPLFKIAQGRRADLAKAQVEFEQIRTDTQSLIGNAENQALIELLGRLSAGEFDRATRKGAPGVQPGGAERTKWIGEFQAFLLQGKGGAQDFMETLDGLDVSLRTGEQSVRKMMQAFVADSANMERTRQHAKALQDLGRTQAQVSEDLENAQAAYNNRVDGLPSSLMQLERSFARLSEKLKDSAKGFDELNAAKSRLVSDTMQIENLNRQADLERQLREVQAAGITNRRQREAEADRMTRETIERQYRAQVEYAQKTITDREQLNARLAELDNIRLQSLAIQSERYAQASRSELQRLADEWTDVMQQMERASASWANSLAEYLGNVVSGQKASFKDLALSILKDMQQIALKSLLADGFNALTGGKDGANGKGGVIGSLLGAIGLGGQQEQGMPIDTAANAMRVTVVGGAISRDFDVPDVAGAAKEGEKTEVTSFITDMATTIKNKVISIFGSVKDLASGAFSFLADLGSSLLDTVSGGLSSVFDSLMGAFGGAGGAGGGDWLSSAVSMGMSLFGFADGGIMTKHGSIPLRKYANGGIATSPQLAMFGEGSMNEAYVPLPDGRSIPVSFANVPTGNSSTSNAVAISITVNQDGSGQQESKGDEADRWKSIAEKVRSVVLQELGTQKRPGGLLNQ